MFVKSILIVATAIMPLCAFGADVTSLDDAIRLTQIRCGGISEQMSKLKTMAGINTAVTGVGTAVGVGATVSGVVKKEYDDIVDKAEDMIARYKSAQASADNSHLAGVYLDQAAIRAQLQQVDLQAIDENKAISYSTQIEQLESVRDMGVEKSKTLGNVRTGLMATSTATNIAGAIIAANNNVDDDLKAKIHACLDAVDIVRNAKVQGYMDGADAAAIARADKIISACGNYEYAQIDKINVRSKGGAISSGVGIATGMGGTITSAVANSDKTRSGDAEYEKNMNTAANVLGGVTSAASLTATVFNATQIKAIKDVSKIADECEEALK